MKGIFKCVLVAAAVAAIAMAADVTGKWTGTIAPDGGDTHTALLVLKQDGATITGSAGPDESQQFPIKTGKIDGNKVVIEVAPTDESLYHLELVLDGDHLKGDATFHRGDDTMTGKVDVSRVK
jgi:hypothetical protein